MLMNNIFVLIIMIIILVVLIIFNNCKKENFVNSKNKIDKAYVINLKKNKDRLKRFKKNTKKANIKVERFNAVYGKDLPKEHPDIIKYFVKNHNLNPGEIGCALSHIKIWEDALKNNYKNIIVFEDDAIIPKDFWYRFNEAYNELPKDWDILFLGLNWPYVRKISENISKVIFKEGTSNFGTHAMLVNVNNIKKLLNKKINEPIDLFIKNNNKGCFYFSHHIQIVNDYSFDSNISKTGNGDKLWNDYKNKIIYVPSR